MRNEASPMKAEEIKSDNTKRQLKMIQKIKSKEVTKAVVAGKTTADMVRSQRKRQKLR